MEQPNFERMIKLAEDTFATRSDPDQIAVTEEAREKLMRIDPETLSEESDPNGPIAWVMCIPTTRDLMRRFVDRRISERQLLDLTTPGAAFDALYLCSALVLPEHRRKGLATRVALRAIRSMMQRHRIRELFYWEFTAEGGMLARSLAATLGMHLHARRVAP